MNFCPVVQSLPFSITLKIDHKFSIGFRSGELPGQSKTHTSSAGKLGHHLRCMGRCKVLLKYPRCIIQKRSHFWHHSLLDINILQQSHPTNWLQRNNPRTLQDVWQTDWCCIFSLDLPLVCKHVGYIATEPANDFCHWITPFLSPHMYKLYILWPSGIVFSSSQ